MFVLPEPNISFSMTAYIADALVNPYGIKMLLAYCVSTIFINGKPTFINGAKKFSNPTSF